MSVAIVYPEESYRIMGACFEVYKEMGCGAQVHNYLKATGYKLGLLVNVGHHPKVEYERVAV